MVAEVEGTRGRVAPWNRGAGVTASGIGRVNRYLNDAPMLSTMMVMRGDPGFSSICGSGLIA